MDFIIALLMLLVFNFGSEILIGFGVMGVLYVVKPDQTLKLLKIVGKSFLGLALIIIFFKDFLPWLSNLL
ncbi:hypothetical protein LAh6_158 [Aeromonas phage LAh_6]|uniref:Uncharacterized protein n=2 Tax=Lahexavirus TaxID=2843411 RepID=A0A513ZZZ4_9CAUD|nr:hypothetical protein HWC29_gp097 [Aeromonas phage 4_4572]YP_009847332.1 hypothetical protein HWC30_gp158 [Aeromonas phage LAh_6]QDH46600.1 hypothetical protein LAh6_158 [Aeromonas phage LAh_6]QEG09089.1 hypothetical protein [Aeromonas phage 4_4572]